MLDLNPKKVLFNFSVRQTSPTLLSVPLLPPSTVLPRFLFYDVGLGSVSFGGGVPSGGTGGSKVSREGSDLTRGEECVKVHNNE